jgi:hypothetical protein
MLSFSSQFLLGLDLPKVDVADRNKSLQWKIIVLHFWHHTPWSSFLLKVLSNWKCMSSDAPCMRNEKKAQSPFSMILQSSECTCSKL